MATSAGIRSLDRKQQAGLGAMRREIKSQRVRGNEQCTDQQQELR